MVKFYTLVLALILVACSGASHKSEDKGPESAFDIPFHKYVLDNGLTVLIHEDHSDPVAHVDVTYHVGSAREELGKSGFAHLFEHMMFQGSENVADEEHIKTVTEAGGTMNGTTNRDRTNYFETVPVNHLETMLWLEADRMGFFLEGITQEKFEVQRATVKNEKGQRYDNAAYGRVWELIAKTLYPYGHPYSWLTIGDLEDLDRATAEDLRNFFLRWYGPNNATLTIGGDVDPDEVMAMVEKYFGGIARGPEVKDLSIPSFELEGNRYVSYYDDKIQFPAVTLSFPTVPLFHPDAPALQCLAEILGNGKDSYLYQNLVANQKAINASASHIESELNGEFFMFVLPFPGKPLPEFEQELRNTLKQFEEAGVSEMDIQKYKAQFEKNLVQGLERVSGKVSQLAYYQTFAGEAEFLREDVQRHLSITPEDVMRVYEQYVKDQPSVVLSVLARPDGTPAKADNYTIPTDGVNPYPTTDYSGLTYEKAQDNFDRSLKPQAAAAKLVTPPEFWQHKSDNGINVIGSEQNELPLINIEFTVKGGVHLDSLHPEKLGLSSLMSQMLNTSSENFSEAEFAEELEKIGASVGVSSSSDGVTIWLSTLSENFDQALSLFEERLFRPAFLPDDFARIQKQNIESAQSTIRQASSIAPMVYNKLIYGPDDIRGIEDTRLIKTLPSLSVADASAFYRETLGPKDSILVIVGDIDKNTALQKLAFLTNWQGAQAPKPSYKESPKIEKTTLYFVDKAGAPQSEIRVGYLTDLTYDVTGEYFKAGLMNFALGGAFNSRINLNLREDKGVTYGARSWFAADELPGPFTVSTSVKAESTGLSVSEIMREIKDYATDGIRDDELALMRSSIAQKDALSYETYGQKASFLNRLAKYDIDHDYVGKQKRIINNISADELNQIAKARLPYDKMNILVVGDKSSVLPQLQELGYPVTELDVEGNPINP